MPPPLYEGYYPPIFCENYVFLPSTFSRREENIQGTATFVECDVLCHSEVEKKNPAEAG